MAEAGILGEDDRVELLRGEVVELSPVGKRHAYVVNTLVDLLSPLRDRAVLLVQNPLGLSPDTEVYPDLALLQPPRTRYRDRLPEAKDALLVVEVAETSLDHDLKVKLPLSPSTPKQGYRRSGWWTWCGRRCTSSASPKGRATGRPRPSRTGRFRSSG